ncbi:MAG: PD-(D/E)XK nuclease family protein [Flavobacteriales bacterium]
MIPYLYTIAERLVKKHGQEMDKLTIVLPSKRAIVFFKHYLSDLIEKPAWLPKIYSIEDFICDLSSLQIADNLTLQFILYEAYCKNPIGEAPDSLDDFFKWSQTLLYDFNEIDRYLVDADSLFLNLKNIKTLESWNVEEENLSDFQLQYLNFFEHLHKWYNTYHKLLVEKGVCYQGLAYREAVKNINFTSEKISKVWFVGLNALTKAEKVIVDYLHSNCGAELFFDGDVHYVSDQKHEAGYFIRQHIEKWGAFDLNNTLSKPKNIEVIACAGNVSQAKVAGNILDKLEDENFNQTALVLADEKLLFPVLNNLSSSIKSVNITMGSPLSSTPLYNFFNTIFNLHIRKQKHNKHEFYFKDLIKLFDHSYFSILVSHHDFNLLKIELRKRNAVYISYEELKNIFEDLKLKNWKFIEMIFRDWSDPAFIINSSKLILESLKEKLLTDKASVESEVLFSIYQCFQILEHYINDETLKLELKLNTIYSVFTQLISKESIPFTGEPLDGLQLMGVLETRTLDFKNIIILSVNEDKLPMGKSSNSFIPFDLKRHYKMPTHQERDAIFSYHFYRLLQRTKNAYLIYNTQSDQFGSGEKSRFILQVENELKNSKIKLFNLELQTNSYNSSSIDISKTEDIQQKVLEWLSKGVSPTALTTFLDCKLKFYFNYLAKIKKDKTIEEFIESDVFGSVIHSSLEKAIHPFLNRNLNHEILSKIKKSSIVNCKNLLENKFGARIKSGKNYLILQVATKMINQFFENEKLFCADNSNISYKVLEQENRYDYTFNVIDKKVVLSGIIDRVDKLGTQIRLVDYKTGKVISNDLVFDNYIDLINKRNKSKAFQLMIYSLLYFKNNFSSNFVAGNFSFRNLNEGFLSLRYKKEKEPLVISSQELEEFEKELIALVEEIISDKLIFSQTDDLEVCKWCDFRSICERE